MEGGSTSWDPLKDINASDPVQMAEYVISYGFEDEPAFDWWVPHDLKRRE
jgi:hypothetical protein